MTASYFTLDRSELAPNEIASGPWSPDMLHGRLLGGVAARAIQNEWVEPGWRVARLTIDLFRPAAMKPVQVTTNAVRQGRKVQIIDALLTCDGHEVGRVTAGLLAESENPPGSIWRPSASAWPDPESLPDPDDPAGDSGASGWLFRLANGGFGTAEQSRVWTNETRSLVDDEPVSPLVRAAVSGDIACPLANSSDQGLHYINADYTMYLARYPVGEWVGIEVAQQLQADGISLAAATLVDRDGPFATSNGSSLARAPLTDD